MRETNFALVGELHLDCFCYQFFPQLQKLYTKRFFDLDWSERMTILEVPTLYERFYWHHHNCYHSASLTCWLVKMWLMYSMVDIMRTAKLYFILSNDEVAFEMLCNPYSIWLFCCWKSLLKVSMQPFSLQNTILWS